MQRYYFLIFFISIAFISTAIFPIQNSRNINLLILSGNRNHEWDITTPFLKQMYEKSGVFSVEVNNRLDTLNYLFLSEFDVILDNWNEWPERNCTWTEEAREGLVRFVREGGGLIFVHAAGAACYDWPEFREMAMATWGEKTKHGKIEPINVSISDKQHPVTNGVQDFRITDELWVETEMMDEYQLLCKAFSPKENNGRDQMEPVVFFRRYGKGICYYNILGHDVNAMSNKGWQLLTLRGTQWAAGQKITISGKDKIFLQQ